MAQDKKSFVLYSDILSMVRKLSIEQAGGLFLTILMYVNDENPIITDKLIDIAFDPIKLQLKRDLIKYEDKKIKWSEAGKRSAELRNAGIIQQTSTNVESIQQTSTVNDNVNVNVTVNDNVINKKKKEADFLSKIIEGFQKSYFEIFGSEYVLMAKGKERAAASKILQLYKTKYPDANSETTIEALSSFFKNCCMIPDDWLQKNMSLPIIVSKFNEINNKLKNGTNKKHSPQATNIAGIAAMFTERVGQ